MSTRIDAGNNKSRHTPALCRYANASADLLDISEWIKWHPASNQQGTLRLEALPYYFCFDFVSASCTNS